MTNIDINQIKHLYYHEKKSVPEVAEILGCSPEIIYDLMKKHGMQRRSYSEAHRLRHAQTTSNVDDAEIVRLYFEEYLSMKDVGDRVGLSAHNVQKRLTAAGYQPRKKWERTRKSRHPHRKSLISKLTDADLAEIERLYYEEGLSLVEIASRYNCSETAVRTYFKQHGVQFRTAKEGQALRRNREKERKEVPEERNESPRTYTPPKRGGKVFEPYPVLPSDQVTPERILQLRKEEDLMIGDIAEICSLSPVEVYNILQKAGVT